jgi:hypothetical protein
VDPLKSLTLWGIRAILKVSQNSYVGREFRLTFDYLNYLKECPCGVGTSNFGKIKKKHLTLAKQQIHENKFHGKLVKPLKMVFSKF